MTARRVFVVGSGIAGLCAALSAARHGCLVQLVTKGDLEASSTRYAQGGIAAAVLPGDDPAAHLHDTLAAGSFANHVEAVQALTSEGPDRIRDLIAWGVTFDRDDAGALRGGLEGAHSHPRILHAGGDATGAEVQRALAAAVRASAIKRHEHAFFTDLVTDAGGSVRGVEIWARHDPARLRILAADAVVLATGGAGELYAHSTNPPIATGDGIAAAVRAGAELADMEFVQFHPTVLAAGDAFLVSEAVRGEGAVLRDETGARFLLGAHPAAELAPRDVVARAIARTMASQGGRPVWLDATNVHSSDATVRAQWLSRRFPTIDAQLRRRNLDWARTPVPVTPAAHFLMGGVRTDLWGRTTVPGLYAVGETACTGVHGANRLASNSLLEGAVFGTRVGDAVARDNGPAASIADSTAAARDGARHVSNPAGSAPRQTTPAYTRERLQALMWHNVGLERDAEGLTRAAELVQQWRAESHARARTTDLENENLLLVADAVITASLARPASLGSHVRRDAETVPVRQ